MLERPFSSGLQVLWYLSCCFWMCRDFGNRSSDQKVRSLSCLCSGAQSLCTLLIWDTRDSWCSWPDPLKRLTKLSKITLSSEVSEKSKFLQAMAKMSWSFIPKNGKQETSNPLAPDFNSVLSHPLSLEKKYSLLTVCNLGSRKIQQKFWDWTLWLKKLQGNQSGPQKDRTTIPGLAFRLLRNSSFLKEKGKFVFREKLYAEGDLEIRWTILGKSLLIW